MSTKNTFQAILAVVAGLAITVGAQAGPVYFDFGDSAQPTPVAENYNHIFVNDTSADPGHQDVLSVANAIDRTGASTGISLTASGFFLGSNQNGTTAPTGDAAIFHAQATRDNAFGHALAFGTNPLTPQATLAISGLNPNMYYNFTFFASRTGVGDIREAMYTVNGSNSGVGLLDASNNTSNVAVVADILSDAGGNISVLVEPGPNNNNSSRFYYLGALCIECIVPEPASGMLLMFGAVGLVACRRSFKVRRLS